MARASLVVLQVGLLSGLWLAIDVLRSRFGWSMPAGLIGFSLLAVGLFSGLIKTRWLQSGTNWLMAEMLLFFIPAVMAVSQHAALLRAQGVRIVAVILIGTVLVMAVTACLVDLVWRWRQRRHAQ